MDLIAWYFVMAFGVALLLNGLACYLTEKRLQFGNTLLGLIFLGACVIRIFAGEAGCQL